MRGLYWTKAILVLCATLSLVAATAGEVHASPRLIRREHDRDAASFMLPASYPQAADVSDTDDDPNKNDPAAEARAEELLEEANAGKLLQDLMDVESDMADDFKERASERESVGDSDPAAPAILVDRPSGPSVIRPEAPSNALNTERSQNGVTAERQHAAGDSGTASAGTTDSEASSLNSNSAGGSDASSLDASQEDALSLPTADELADVSSFDLNPAIEDIWSDVASGNRVGTARAERNIAVENARKIVKHAPAGDNSHVAMMSATHDGAGKQFRKENKANKKVTTQHGKASGKNSEYHKSGRSAPSGDVENGQSQSGNSRNSNVGAESGGADGDADGRKSDKSTEKSDVGTESGNASAGLSEISNSQEDGVGADGMADSGQPGSLSSLDVDEFGADMKPTAPTAIPAAVLINDPEADIIGADGQWPGWTDEPTETPI